MKQILDFLYANPIGCLATVDDSGTPQVRPFEFMFEQGGKLWFYTSNTREVFCQLQCNPAIEFCSVSKELNSVRLSGEVIFGIDLSIKLKMLEQSDLVRAAFQTADNPEFEIFYLKHGRATLFDLSGQIFKEVMF